MRQEVERMMATADPAATDGRLRQIYFPAGEGTYHLLTVIARPQAFLASAERQKQEYEAAQV